MVERIQSSKGLPISSTFASDLLDKIINQEAKDNNGFTLYKRGADLKQALIDKTKVGEYIDNVDKKKRN